MRAQVAVATVKGKAYFVIVQELKHHNISIVSLVPGETVPAQIRVVVTTPEEQKLIDHRKILTYDIKTDPDVIGSEVIKILQGKETYENVVVGVDPGEVFGIAVLADGIVIDSKNCVGVEETLNSIKNILKVVDTSKSAVTVKVGNGVPVFKELLNVLDEALPREVTLKIVGEAGTNRHNHGQKNGRTIRHMVSALRIAERGGYNYLRRNDASEHDS